MARSITLDGAEEHAGLPEGEAREKGARSDRRACGLSDEQREDIMKRSTRIHFWIFDALSTVIVILILIGLSRMILKSWAADFDSWSRAERAVYLEEVE